MDFRTLDDLLAFMEALVIRRTDMADYRMIETAPLIKMTVRLRWWTVFIPWRHSAAANALYEVLRDGLPAWTDCITATTIFPFEWDLALAKCDSSSYEEVL